MVIAAAVVLFAALNPAPAAPAPPDGSRWRPVFQQVVDGERAARQTAMEQWGHDAWSQHDAFGALEAERVRTVAMEQGLSPQDVFLVVDEGIRSGWTTSAGERVPATVVPHKPRPAD